MYLRLLVIPALKAREESGSVILRCVLFESCHFVNCGYHEYKNFDKITARQEYQLRVNEVLRQYSDGYELSDNGCILILVEGGFDNLLKAAVPEGLDGRQIIQNKINHAVDKYRRGRRAEERRDGIRISRYFRVAPSGN
ncbi:hypothetical protein [Legionella bozemanae]|uniref:hypothetical protein n=1 Tax=Legionella bozemanae TaxID=447 RepID=UPI000AD029FB|nr:hypothetical protein [Legionella bozemanae]